MYRLLRSNLPTNICIFTIFKFSATCVVMFILDSQWKQTTASVLSKMEKVYFVCSLFEVNKLELIGNIHDICADRRFKVNGIVAVTCMKVWSLVSILNEYFFGKWKLYTRWVPSFVKIYNQRYHLKTFKERFCTWKKLGFSDVSIMPAYGTCSKTIWRSKLKYLEVYWH